ncbi:uncharacterized protein LOC121413940 [Lytechinus variegatus]|uniref:uncharacterized protein LOC121413940 n=1 Tax=Lytechinus variegatus TaxID=7654 RepID=UPI001BB15CB1|nr:uncharacterized protein LOC121413940 [Lytechinus variegatus]
MTWQVAIALLLVGVGVVSASLGEPNFPGCWPRWTSDRPRPACDCSKASDRDSWVYGGDGFLTCWGNPGMVYKLNAELQTHSEASKGCNNWDEAVCEGEYSDGEDQRLWRTGLLNIQFENELEGGVIPALEKACIAPRTNGYVWFWVNRIDYGKVTFADGSSTKQDGECLAIRVGNDGRIYGRYFSCGQKLPSFIRITPVQSH